MPAGENWSTGVVESWSIRLDALLHHSITLIAPGAILPLQRPHSLLARIREFTKARNPSARFVAIFTLLLIGPPLAPTLPVEKHPRRGVHRCWQGY
jgi:hypothetical protein